MARSPLSTLLSRPLVAFTIEFDNEFEHRFAQTGVGRPFGASMVMWSNCMRFVGDGIAIDELVTSTQLPKPLVFSMLGGMERWRYVYVASGPGTRPSRTKRDGWGSGRGLRLSWLVRPTEAGRTAQEIWPSLFGVVEGRWRQRFGSDAIRDVRRSLADVVGQLAVELPAYLPIVGSANGMRSEIAARPRQPGAADASLCTLLARALLAYTLDFEHRSEVSLPLTANFLRVLDETGVDLRELPARAGVSKEATAMAVRFLSNAGYVTIQPGEKRVRLAPQGVDAQAAVPRLHSDIGRAWETQFGRSNVRALRRALQDLLDRRDGDRVRLALGLRPYPDGWRATRRYAEQTNAVLADPLGRLPHHPMVLHRGGWPDGS